MTPSPPDVLVLIPGGCECPSHGQGRGEGSGVGEILLDD